MYGRSSAQSIRRRQAGSKEDHRLVSHRLKLRLMSRGGIGIIAGTVLQTAAVNYDMMCVARVFNGVFNGLLTSTVPSYQSECAKPHQRGPLVILSGTLIGFVSRLAPSPSL